jgi:CBS domain-containing protein
MTKSKSSPARPPRRHTSRKVPVHRAPLRQSSSLVYNVRVADVLSKPVLLVGEDASLFDALMLMRTHNVSGLPVIDSRRHLVGVLSEKDLARVVLGSSDYPEIKGLLDVLMLGLSDQPSATLQRIREGLEAVTVSAAMSRPPFVIHPDAPLELAAEVMRDQGINRLPVVEDDRLVGIVTRHDLVRALIPAVLKPSRG